VCVPGMYEYRIVFFIVNLKGEEFNNIHLYTAEIFFTLVLKCDILIVELHLSQNDSFRVAGLTELMRRFFLCVS
jgi:hypothetical protein